MGPAALAGAPRRGPAGQGRGAPPARGAAPAHLLRHGAALHRHRHRRGLRGRPALVRRLRARGRCSTWSSRPSSTPPGSPWSSVSSSPWCGGSSMRPEHLPPRLSTTLVLCGLLFMGVSGFLLEAYRIAAQPNEWAPAAFVGYALSRVLFPTRGRRRRGTPSTRCSGGCTPPRPSASSSGLAWTGFSHVFVVPGTVAAHDPARPRTQLTTPFDLIAAMESDEDVEAVAGTATTAVIGPADKLAADACVACGRCHQECPGARGRAAALAARPHAGRAALAGHRRRRRGGGAAGGRLRGRRLVVHQLLRLRAGLPGADPPRGLRARLPPRPRRREPPRRAEVRRAAGAGQELEPVPAPLARARRLAHGAALRRRDHLRRGRARGAARVPVLDRLRRGLRRALQPGGAGDHGPAPRRRRELRHARARRSLAAASRRSGWARRAASRCSPWWPSR